MAEHRFFQTFMTVGASMMLVGGSLVLLTSTAPFTSPPEATEPSTPDSARVSVATLDLSRPSPPVEPTVDPGDTVTAASEPEAAVTDEAAVTELPAADDNSVASLGGPAAPEAIEAGQEDTAEGMAATDEVAEAEPAATPEPDGAITDTASAEAEPAATPETDGTTTDAASAEPATTPEPDVAVAPVAPENSTVDAQTNAAPAEPVAVAEEKTNAASDQIGEILTALPPRTIASDSSGAATGKVAKLLAATPPAPTPKDANPDVAVVTPAPPLPRHKPEEEPQAETVAALPAPQEKPAKTAKPAAPAAAPEQTIARREATEPHAKSKWQPMGLAPADKPAIAPVPTARPTSAAYSSKVWSALARHKPRAGQSGSALVMFAIGENGGLRGLRIGRSSGNARIDQLALATVRGAAPFPPPPSGTASYSIRIDFH